jgi:hypothetical protein
MRTMTMRAALSLSHTLRERKREMYVMERLKEGDGHGGTWHGPNEET